MLWGTSSLALYIPWAGSSGVYLGLSLWLWLGVLDAIQGVGLGMILLQVRSMVQRLFQLSWLTRLAQTLSRLHVCATLAFSQVIGSIAVMVAHGTAPNRLGPGSVFPDASTWDFQGMTCQHKPKGRLLIDLPDLIRRLEREPNCFCTILAGIVRSIVHSLDSGCFIDTAL